MSGQVVGLRPSEQAEFADAERKRWDTLRALACLRGLMSHRIVDEIGLESFCICNRRFGSLEAAEDWLDELDRAAE